LTGYSGTPLHRKLGIKPGHVVALLGEPSGWAIADLPLDVSVRHQLRGRLDVIVGFFGRRAKLEQRLPRLLNALPGDGSLWIAWPRRASGHVSDITENGLRDLILPTGLVDTKVAALDDDWSALKFMWRKELRSRGRARSGRAGDAP
jgi:hypothetical protein